jgi:phosphate transport system protein
MRTILVSTPSDYHFEKSLQRDIDQIRDKILCMAGLCEGALRNSMLALQKKDRQLAYTVILRDRCIDELETELDRLCLEFIIRQQPVAGHLRFIYSTIKIIRELERIGDYAESMARQTLHLLPIAKLPHLKQLFELADVSIPMLKDALKAFLAKDAELAKKTMVLEEKADRLRTHFNGELFQLRQQDTLPLEALTPLMTIARRLERVADQAKNICEETIYMATGEVAKHRHIGIFSILFIDDNNACLSQMAEAIGQAMHVSKFSFKSAGIKSSPIDPMTIEFLSAKGMDISACTSKTVEQILKIEPVQVVVALTSAVRDSIPVKLEKTIILDWHIKNPSQIQGKAAQVHRAYDEAFNSLKNQIQDLVQAVLGQNSIDSNSCTSPGSQSAD